MPQIDKKKINKLINSSQEVFVDCALENGGLVAANSTKNYYDRSLKNYFYVWPRDGAYICLAAQALGRTDIQKNFFIWLLERAEGWQETGVFFENYNPNGRQNLFRFQPDQTGIALLAACSYWKKNKEKNKKIEKFIKGTSRGLSNVWEKDHFRIMICDLWEERLGFPQFRNIFSYSLATCARGLEEANKIFPNKKNQETARDMKKLLKNKLKKEKYIIRSWGDIPDTEVDASALGLIWPFEIFSPQSRIAQNTVKEIENKLEKNTGIYRYEKDRYDSRIIKGEQPRAGAGYWPLLNFWFSIVLSKMGRREKALKYYNKVLKDVDNYIPEQIFNNNIQEGISPLAWSHAMFVLASQELGLLAEE